MVLVEKGIAQFIIWWKSKSTEKGFGNGILLAETLFYLRAVVCDRANY